MASGTMAPGLQTADMGLTLANMTLAVVWHFWIAVPLAFGAVVAVIATIVGYLNKVTATRYPRD